MSDGAAQSQSIDEMRYEMEERVLALDLGGTKLLIGEVDKTGKIIRKKRYTSGYRSQEEEMGLIVDSLKDYIKTENLNLEEISSAGIGLIGQVDAGSGIWNMIDPERRQGIPVTKVLEKYFGIPFYIDNDVKAATRAEITFGMGKGEKDFIYLNIGTGIAAGIVSGGRLVRGLGNDAGEVGHTTVGVCTEVECTCGRSGCVEAIASGGGMDRRIRKLADQYPDSPLTAAARSGFVGAETIFAAAREGDPLAVRITEDAACALAGLLANLSRLTAPSMIVLGGGIGGDQWMREKIFEKAKEQGGSHVLPTILSSGLNPDTAGLVGAAVVGMNLQEAEGGAI